MRDGPDDTHDAQVIVVLAVGKIKRAAAVRALVKRAAGQQVKEVIGACQRPWWRPWLRARDTMEPRSVPRDPHRIERRAFTCARRLRRGHSSANRARLRYRVEAERNPVIGCCLRLKCLNQQQILRVQKHTGNGTLEQRSRCIVR